MRRKVLKNSVQKVLNDLISTGLAPMIEGAVKSLRESGPKTDNSWISLDIISKYLSLVSDYDDNEIYVHKSLDLTLTADPNTWQRLFIEPEPSLIMPINNRIQTALRFMPSILSVLEMDYEDGGPVESKLISNDLEIQTVILTDEGGSFSSTQRLIELLTSVQDLYRIISEIEQVKSDSIAVIGMDSGSEKSFDLLGVARLMHELRELLKFAYTTIAFHKQNVTVKNLQVAGETLGLVAKIGKMESERIISSEDAARMKHGLFSGLEKFVGTGAYIPEMSAREGTEPALVMRPKPGLLTGPTDEIVRDANEPRASFGEHLGDELGPATSEYTTEQIAAALALLNEAKSSGEKPPVRKGRRPAKR